MIKKGSVAGKITGVFALIAICILVNASYIGTSSLTFKKSLKELTFEHLLAEAKPVYKNHEVRLYFENFMGRPFLIYVFKNLLSEEAVNARFYWHIYAKNRKATNQFLNNDHIVKPDTFMVQDSLRLAYFIPLNTRQIKPDSIDYFNTGRFIPGKGRILEIPAINPLPIDANQPGLPELSIILKRSAYQTIVNYREKALKGTIIPPSVKKYVEAKLLFGQQGFDGKIRLKGDWLDHINDSLKWSYRIKLAKGEAIMNCRKFSVQHPKTRYYDMERMLMDVAAEQGILTPQYTFVDLSYVLIDKSDTLTKKIGTMAFEELANERIYKEEGFPYGPILAYDEGDLWNKRMANRKEGNFDNDVKVSTKIKAYGVNKNRPQINERARKLFFALRSNNKPVSEAYDLEKLAKFVIIANLFGAQHGLTWHNLRAYFNPEKEQFEPIAFDMNGGHRIKEFIHFPYVNEPVEKAHVQKQSYYQSVMELLPYFLSDQYWSTFVKMHYSKHISYSSLLQQSFNMKDYLLQISENRKYLIKEWFEAPLTQSYCSTTDSGKVLTIKNASSFPIALIEVAPTTISLSGEQTINPHDSLQFTIPENKETIKVISELAYGVGNSRTEQIYPQYKNN